MDIYLLWCTFYGTTTKELIGVYDDPHLAIRQMEMIEDDDPKSTAWIDVAIMNEEINYR